MPRTRNANAASATRHVSRPQRSTLARRTKPTKSLYLDDSDETSASNNPDESDISLHSDDADESTDDDVDSGIDRAIGDLDLQLPRPDVARTSKRPRSTRRTGSSKTSRRSKNIASTTKGSSGRSNKGGSGSTPRAVKRRPAQSGRSPQTPSKKSKTGHNVDSPVSIPGVIPDWRNPGIPYSAWVNIFYYAATAGGALDNAWLLHAATTCKAFVEPALSALYQCPSPKTTIKTRKLAALLAQPASNTLFDYRSKIRSMYINIDKFHMGQLSQFIRPLRCLKEVIIFTELDQPPYRDLDRTIRWRYPAELFRDLEPSIDPEATEDEPLSPISLKSWEWSSRLLGGYVADVNGISAIHQLPCFSHLTKLSFTNFQVPSLYRPALKPGDDEGAQRQNDEDGEVIDAIARSISELQYLNHLVFESSTVMNDRLLSLLPKHLVHFELINCWEVNSDDLARFLSTHGRDMRSLNLSHNQSLDLSFLTDLAEACPNLRELHMNMSYYRHHDSISDADPMYDQALLPTQLPLWPASLRAIEIDNIRNWSVEAAETFMQSLIDSAPNLPNLRRLALKTMLNIPWQMRAQLRQTWREKLEKVFLRPWEPPKLHTSVRKQEGVDGPHDTSRQQKKRKTTEPSPPSRRSGRIAAHDSDSDRHSSRHLRTRDTKPHYRDIDTDDDEYDANSSNEENHDTSGGGVGTPEDADNLPKQGMCQFVNILFDNQKVRELQYGMEDFDDDEESSGEEWNRDEDIDDPIFVWR